MTITEHDEKMKQILHRKKTVFLLGNGFDIAFGANTSYGKFYESKYFTDLIPNSNLATFIDIKNKIIK